MHRKSASHLSFEIIYRHAYKIVLRKKADDFYDRLQDWEMRWLTNIIKTNLHKLLVPSLLNGTEQAIQASSVSEKRALGDKFLKGCKETWDDHQLVMNMATDVFMYLDRVHCSDQNRPSIYSTGMAQFKDCVLLKPAVQPQSTPRKNVVDLTGEEDDEIPPPILLEILKKIILEQIAMDRDGDVIDKTVIKGCIYMLEGLYETPQEHEDERLYLTSFEKDFLDASREFYREEGTKLLEEADAATYCKHTIRRIKEEQDRCRSTLSQSTSQKITHVVEDELIRSRIKQLIMMDSGVKHMVDNDRFDDLSLIFDLNSRIDPKKTELTFEIQRRVVEVGAQINEAAVTTSSSVQQPQPQQDKEDPGKPNINQQTVAALQWVAGLLTLKDKYDHLWEKSFESDPIIQPALTKSFTESINAFPRCSEFISLFIDDNMKKGIKDKTEQEVDRVLEKAITLLRYIQDKDMFERYYKKHLCKRLLMRKSVSIDVEKQMVSRMKIELGNSFTNKLENMFKDMALSEEMTAGYKARVSGGESRTELGINVLTTMVWPLETMGSTGDEEQRLQCIYPASIDRIKKGFETFYASKHSGRQLTWMANMGTADIRAVFPKVAGAKEGTRLAKDRRHELNVSTYAMVVLMLFNDVPEGGSLSFEDIQSKTNIGENELKRNLQALAVASKTRILVKEPMTKDIKRTDRFFFNDSFQSQFVKLKVGVVAPGNKVEGDKERIETEKKNNESRGYTIDAAVVRIMKYVMPVLKRRNDSLT